VSAGRGPLVVVGDALLDRDVVGRASRLMPDAPAPVVDAAGVHERPGGAGLAAVLAARDGREVVLVTALADDAPGHRLAELLEAAGVRVLALPLRGSTPEKTRIRAGDRSLLRLDSGGGHGLAGGVPDEVGDALDAAGAVLVSDYGRGVPASAAVRALLARCTSAVPVVWDPHPRGAEPVPGVRLVTPNLDEATRAAGGVPGADSLERITAYATELRRRWACTGVAVTLGPRGALLSFGTASPLLVPVPVRSAGDPCGAGDRFAAAAAGLLLDGALVSEAVQGAVAAAAGFVAAGGAAGVVGPGGAGGRDGTAGDRDGTGTAGDGEGTRTGAGGADEDARDGIAAELPGSMAAALRVVARTRSAGGTVVATGGCFDLLHPGHVATLEAARGLGDCLVVCLNSDASVRRLKGPERPVVGEEDRARVVGALGCVDAVVVFGEDTPERVISDLRPDVWVKGGDYADGRLPEAELVRSWGGQAVIVPYLDGRSSSRLVAAARSGGGGVPPRS